MSVAESIRRRLHIKPHHTTKNPEGGASAEVDKLKAELSRSRTDLGKVRSELLSLKDEYEASKATSTSEIKKAREQAAAEIKAAEANLEAVEHKMLVLENERKAAAAAKFEGGKGRCHRCTGGGRYKPEGDWTIEDGARWRVEGGGGR